MNKITVNSKLRSIFYSLLLVVFGLVLLYPLCPLRGNLKFTLFYGTFIDTYKYFTCTFLISSSIYGIFKGQTDSFSLLFANLLYALSVTRNMAYANQYEPTTTIWENELSGMIFIIVIALILIKNLFQVINEYGILQNHLMEEVESRTIEVTNLLIERKTLLSNMMHDLKSPVSAIQAFVELISTDTNLQNPKLKEYLTNIQQKSTLMQNRILSFQNVTLEDEVNLKKEVLWVNQLLSEIHELYLPDTDASGIYFSMTPLSSDVKIMGYPNRLYTLFENLIYNAISFTSLNGTISLCASITQNQVTIQLSDTGVGISPDILPNIFNRQYTNRTTESSSLSGSGIGLHIVASIVKEHRGSLSVKSSLGVGTTFSISIPIYK